jgi:hypothetical protein
MHESEPLKGLNEPVFLPEQVLEAQPSEESKIIIALLMRIYDVQMALLTKVDPDTADRIYDAHERGEDFNPTIYIPEIKDNEE